MLNEEKKLSKLLIIYVFMKQFKKNETNKASEDNRVNSSKGKKKKKT
jgi:hypothetical protein